MKRHLLPLLSAAALLSIAGTTYLAAQPPTDRQAPPPRGEGQGPGPGQGRPRSPLMQALDSDADGKLSPDEIKNASASLAKLDKNSDGTLTEDEIRPPQPGRGQGRPDGGQRPPQGQPGAGNNQGAVNPPPAAPLAADQRALVFSGGNETDPRDRGRPVVLIAGALGVAPEVFREAFSRVRPAGAGQESEPEQVRQNKANLMMALGKFGITNERLDEVSNYYRYVQSRGETWPMTPAQGYARVKDGKVTGVVITNGGSGYSSVPSVSVQGMPEVAVQAKLAYGQDFAKNGSVTSVTAAP